jgi:RecA/RadA recombinase
MQKAIGDGKVETKEYVATDGVPLRETSILRQLTGLPCLPFNKIAQVAGKPDTGKSTTAGETMADAQRAGHYVILMDTEGKFDAVRFRDGLGGDPDEIMLVKTNEIRFGAQLMKDYINAIKAEDADAKILVVWDSVGGSLSRSETERNLADERHAQPGQEAKENGQVVRHLAGMFNKYPNSIAVLLINQTYAKIGFMQKGDAAKGGTGIEFFSSLIVMLKRIKVLTKTEKKVKVKAGIITRATVSKNHLSQGKTSVYQMDFVITAAGVTPSDEEMTDDADEE